VEIEKHQGIQTGGQRDESHAETPMTPELREELLAEIALKSISRGAESGLDVRTASMAVEADEA
jgi:hypothetical protein